MSAIEVTAAQDAAPTLTRGQFARFAVGYVLCNLLWMLPFNAASAVLLPQRFLDEGLSNPTMMIAQLNSVGAIVALVANLFFGAFSDRCRSRFGRRTPYMVIGSVFAGLFLFLTAQSPNTTVILLCWAGFQFSLNALLAPFYAVLSDRIPERNRASMSMFSGLGSAIGGTMGMLLGATFIKSQMTGFAIGAAMIALDGLIVVAVWPREKSAADLPHMSFSLKSILMSFIPPTKGAADFYRAAVGRLLIMMATYMLTSYNLYILEQYLGLDAEDAGAKITIMSIIQLVSMVVAMIISGPLSDRIGRRKPLVIICSIVIAAGMVVPMVWPTVTAMFVSIALVGFGGGIYNTCDQALNVDVLPNREQAGKDMGILNLSNTLGNVAGPFVTSMIVTVTGSYKLVFGVAMAVSLLSIAFIATIKKAR